MFLPTDKYEGPFNDDDFIKEQLAKLPQQWHRGTIKKYSTVFLAEGRTKANIWLRESARDFGIK